MAEKPREAGDEPSTHPLESHPDYVKAIGMVSLETIALELRLANLLARMLALPVRIGQAIYLSPKSESGRLELLRNVAHARLSIAPSKKNTSLGKQMKNALSDILKIAGRAQSLVNLRHRMVHDEWNYSDKEKIVTRRMIDGVPGRQRLPVKKDEIDDLIKQLRTLIDDTYDLSESFREHPPFMADLRKDSTKSGS